MLVFAIIFNIILGGFSLAWAVLSLFRAKASTSWPRAHGVITRSEIVKHLYSRGWGLFIEYQYSVNEKRYKGNRVYFGSRSSLSRARVYVGTFCVGRDVSVHYHPDKPELCVLVPGATIYTWSALAIGPLFLCMSLFFITLH